MHLKNPRLETERIHNILYDLYTLFLVPHIAAVIVLVLPLILLVPSMGIKQGMCMAITQYTVLHIEPPFLTLWRQAMLP
jgi:hypothetical protein